jgi:hypothetical protein
LRALANGRKAGDLNEDPVMRPSAAAALTTAILAMAPQARAQPAVDPADLQCLVFSFALADSKEETARSAGSLAAFYFLGKIDGKTPGANLDDPIIALAKTLKPEDVQKYATRCGAELQGRGKSISELGERLQKAAASEPPPPATKE